MRACVVRELTGPAGLVFDTDAAQPPDFPGAVLIDVRAAGVCFPDLLLSRGEYQLKLPAPFTPGSEVAGVVRSAPADSGLAVGDRAIAAGRRAWISMDRHMGCGVGACLTCVQRISAPGTAEGWVWARVCREGPVFEARNIAWDESDGDPGGEGTPP